MANLVGAGDAKFEDTRALLSVIRGRLRQREFIYYNPELRVRLCIAFCFVW